MQVECPKCQHRFDAKDKGRQRRAARPVTDPGGTQVLSNIVAGLYGGERRPPEPPEDDTQVLVESLRGKGPWSRLRRGLASLFGL
jgi:hypothetical protein